MLSPASSGPTAIWQASDDPGLTFQRGYVEYVRLPIPLSAAFYPSHQHPREEAILERGEFRPRIFIVRLQAVPSTACVRAASRHHVRLVSPLNCSPSTLPFAVLGKASTPFPVPARIHGRT